MARLVQLALPAAHIPATEAVLVVPVVIKPVLVMAVAAAAAVPVVTLALAVPVEWVRIATLRLPMVARGRAVAEAVGVVQVFAYPL